MCQNKDTLQNPLKVEKSNRIMAGMACACIKYMYILFRTYLDKLIDFFFSLHWENKRQSIPNLEKKHALLAESAVSLARKIKNRELKSVTLVEMAIERIKAVNPILNAMTDERFSRALIEANEIDKMIEGGLPEDYFAKRPFLGVPFTCKESHGVSGLLQTLGVKARSDVRAEDDADCVRLVRAAGGVALAVTNVPEINKWQETRNYVFGVTRNPYHTGRTVGGSSGGEGALMAAMATPISLCSDIGGSTRMPAFYCGLFGHNPTANTTNMKGSALRSDDDDTIASVGFISRHAEDLQPLTRIVTQQKTDLIKLDYVDFKKIKFYYMNTGKDLRISPISTDLREAMNRVISKLESVNSPPTLITHEGFSHMFSLWKHEMSKENEDFASLLTNNKYRANCLVELGKKIMGKSDFTFAAILKMLDDQVLPKPNAQWANGLLNQMKTELKELLGDDGVLLFPSCSHPAPYHYSAYLRPFNFAYWGIFNALRFPTTQVPLGVNVAGLPVGIQVVAAPYNDGLCLTVAKYLEKEFGGFVPPCQVLN